MHLSGLHLPACKKVFKLSAYANDVIVLENEQSEINILVETVNNFGKISSAKVNWEKSEGLIVGTELGKKLTLPGGLVWNRGGFKYLGIYLRD